MQIQKLTAPDLEQGDAFGESVAIGVDAVVVGAPFADRPQFGLALGAAYVFERAKASGHWVQVKKLVASDPAADNQEEFGWDVAIDGGTAVVGASRHIHLGTLSGSAYVFERDPSTGAWAETGELLASDGGWSDEFGLSVGVAGETVVVGAPDHVHVEGGEGAAYLFERDGGTGSWLETQELQPSNAPAGGFGASVAIRGDTLVVGAPSDDDQGDGAGAAYVFEREEVTGQWLEAAKLLAPDGASFDFFGEPVALDADALLASALGADAVYVFEREPGGGWLEAARLQPDDLVFGSDFGRAVAMSGDVLAVGAPGDDADRGAAYVYGRDPVTGLWLQIAKLLASDGESDSGMMGDRGDWLGRGVAIHGEVMVLGASQDDHVRLEAGSAYVFETTGLGGSATGLQSGQQALCRNRSTGQSVQIDLGGAPFWDCSAAGLVAAPGDEIVQVVVGPAFGRDSVSGTVAGVVPEQAFCLDTVTGELVTIALDGTRIWNCSGAGFEAAEGERVGVGVRGTAE